MRRINHKAPGASCFVSDDDQEINGIRMRSVDFSLLLPRASCLSYANGMCSLNTEM